LRNQIICCTFAARFLYDSRKRGKWGRIVLTKLIFIVMRRVMYLMAILLLSTMIARADETITVSATNSDIAANLDLKVVAKLFGEAKDLEDFEQRLNNPDSAFVNLDLNGDGDVDYIRVIEVTSGTKHLIVLQAILAKDIYQDVASIYVEKDEANNVSVQIIGDEYIYGENYVIEPVYIYRPVIYDWFWSPLWVCWNSPWYWGYYPYWWHTWGCWHHWAYIDHCHHFHHHHHGCSFHYAQTARPASRSMGSDVRRNDYARINPERSFAERNKGITNARQLPVSTRAPQSARISGTTGSTATGTSISSGSASVRRPAGTDRTYGGTYTKASDKGTSTSTATVTRSSGSATTRSSSASTTRPSGTTYTGSGNARTSTTSSSTSTYSRASGSSTSTTTRSSGSSTTRSSGTTSTFRPSGSSSSGVGTYRPSGGSSTRPSGGSSSFPSGGGASSRGGGGGASTRR